MEWENMRLLIYIIAGLLPFMCFSTQSKAQEAKSLAVDGLDVKAPENVTAAAIYYTCEDYFEHKFNSAHRESVGRKSSCISYFFGAGSMVLLMKNQGIDTGLCMPAETSTEDLIRMFTKWMQDHPERGKDIATAALLDAIRDTYKCEGIVPLGS